MVRLCKARLAYVLLCDLEARRLIVQSMASFDLIFSRISVDGTLFKVNLNTVPVKIVFEDLQFKASNSFLFNFLSTKCIFYNCILQRSKEEKKKRNIKVKK